MFIKQCSPRDQYGIHGRLNPITSAYHLCPWHTVSSELAWYSEFFLFTL